LYVSWPLYSLKSNVMLSSTEQASPVYTTLSEIRLRKKMLLKDIKADDKHIKTLWGTLFHKKKSTAVRTPVERMTGLLNNGSGIIDGLLLGWKLYRKFKRK